MFNTKYIDPLVEATGKLLKAVTVVTEEVDAKKQVIMDAQTSINEAQEAINQAKESLSMK